MFLVGIFQWWYGDGLIKHVRHNFLGIMRTADFFSIGLLLQTLFNPFRQISAGRVDGALSVRINAFFDRLFSRLVGATVRLIMVVVGLIALLIRLIWTVIVILLWLILPILPIFAVILWQMGVAP